MATREEKIAELRRLNKIAELKHLRSQNSAQQKDQPYEFSPSEMVSNIPGSAGKLAVDMTYPIRHPINTGKAMYGLAKGLYEKLTPGVQPEEANVDAMTKMLYERYGTVENALKTLETNPAGVLMDASSLISVGGTGAVRTGIKAAERIAKTAKAVDPINVIANTGKVIAKGAARNSDPIDRMLSATKFSTTLDKGGVNVRRKLAETMLKEKIKLGDKGVQKLMDTIDELDGEINKTINTTKGRVRNVPQSKILRHVNDVKREFGNISNSDPLGNVEKINKQVKKWADAQKARGNIPLTPIEVQALKVRLYRESKYNITKSVKKDLINETKKSMARGAKDTIVEQFPEMKDINTRHGNLQELRDPLIQSSSRVGNRDFGGIGVPIKAGAASAVGQNISPEIGFLAGLYGAGKGIMDLPKVKAGNAQMIYNLQKSNIPALYGNNSLKWQMLRNGLTESGRYQQGLLK